MRQLYFAIAASLVLTTGGNAAQVCASAGDMRALQAAVLQQQLAAAAQSCHAAADYERFVAAYRSAIVASDRDVHRFFQRQRTGEGYEAYKARIAHDVSLKSLHDERFCRTAKVVFDLALGRARAAAPPLLVQTGYEGCRSAIEKQPVEKPVMAAAAPPPAAHAAIAPQPRPRLADAQSIPIPKPAPLGPRALAAVNAVPVFSPPPATPKPTRLAVVAPRPAINTPPPAAIAPAPQAAEPPREAAEPPSPREAVDEPPRHEAPETFADDRGNVPNAYRSGAQWVGAEVNDPPPWRWRETQTSNLYRGPDGRLYVRIPHHDRWNDGQ